MVRIPIALCCKYPIIFWNFFSNRGTSFITYLIDLLSFCTFCCVREMQNVRPLNIHSKISFSVYHAHLPSRSFLISTESQLLWTDVWGGTKTLCIKMRTALEMCLRRYIEVFPPYQWSLQHTPQYAIGWLAAWEVCVLGMCLVCSLCVLLGDAVGGCLFFFMLFHQKYLLLFPMLNISMPVIRLIPFKYWL